VISLFIGWMMGNAIPDQRPDRDEITFVATDGKHSVEPVAAVTNIVAG
jgi:hypothetical protein